MKTPSNTPGLDVQGSKASNGGSTRSGTERSYERSGGTERSYESGAADPSGLTERDRSRLSDRDTAERGYERSGSGYEGDYERGTARYGRERSGASGAAGEMKSFIADVEDLIKSATSLTGEDLARAKAALNSRIAAAKRAANEVSDAVAEQARETARATDNYVRQNPWQAIGIGAAAGLFVGFLLARRK